MDPNYIDEEEEAAAMAAMMGFSGFGSQKPPAKKRKFTTDAFIEGQEVKNLDRGGKKGQGSGGNNIPLGKARVIGTGPSNRAIEPVKTNDAEISLDDEDEADGPQYVDTSLPPPIMAGHEAGPQYIDTTEPPPAAVSDQEAKEMQSRIDAILASVESREPEQPPAPGTDASPYSHRQKLTINPPTKTPDPNFMRGGPGPGFGGESPRDAFSDTASMTSSRPSYRGGPRNENWYLDYYDPSFNENPWERLEKEKGLQPLVIWPELKRERNLR